jgi:hypothetical protein
MAVLDELRIIISLPMTLRYVISPTSEFVNVRSCERGVGGVRGYVAHHIVFPAR